MDTGCSAVTLQTYENETVAPLTSADLRDQVDLAIRPDRGEPRVLVNLAVDRERHAAVNEIAQPREADVERVDQVAHRSGLDLKLRGAAGDWP